METRDEWYKPNLLYNIHWRPPKTPETPQMIVETVRFNPSVCTCGEHDCEPRFRMERRVLRTNKDKTVKEDRRRSGKYCFDGGYEDSLKINGDKKYVSNSDRGGSINDSGLTEEGEKSAVDNSDDGTDDGLKTDDTKESSDDDDGGGSNSDEDHRASGGDGHENVKSDSLKIDENREDASNYIFGCNRDDAQTECQHVKSGNDCDKGVVGDYDDSGGSRGVCIKKEVQCDDVWNDGSFKIGDGLSPDGNGKKIDDDLCLCISNGNDGTKKSIGEDDFSKDEGCDDAAGNDKGYNTIVSGECGCVDGDAPERNEEPSIQNDREYYEDELHYVVQSSCMR